MHSNSQTQDAALKLSQNSAAKILLQMLMPLISVCQHYAAIADRRVAVFLLQELNQRGLECFLDINAGIRNASKLARITVKFWILTAEEMES